MAETLDALRADEHGELFPEFMLAPRKGVVAPAPPPGAKSSAPFKILKLVAEPSEDVTIIRVSKTQVTVGDEIEATVMYASTPLGREGLPASSKANGQSDVYIVPLARVLAAQRRYSSTSRSTKRGSPGVKRRALRHGRTARGRVVPTRASPFLPQLPRYPCMSPGHAMAPARRRLAAVRHAELVCFGPRESEVQILSPRRVRTQVMRRHGPSTSRSTRASPSTRARSNRSRPARHRFDENAILPTHERLGADLGSHAAGTAGYGWGGELDVGDRQLRVE
jgi:hypothetical protein